MPKTQDWYFVSKWNEIFDQYTWARIFLRKSSDEDYQGIFNEPEDSRIKRQMELSCSAQFYEISLLYYNILVDLSWTITYVTAEYLIYSKDKNGEISESTEIKKFMSLEESYNILRETENNVTSPHAYNNPFNYLKLMVPEFEEPIDMIINFWKKFSNSKIRKNYNYIKHKGKPNYKELEEATPSVGLSLYIDKTQIPSDINDVQLKIGLSESINELIQFDNEELFPYLDKLLHKLEEIINPSPIVYK
uniref:hypothetical protein n=1 Tax=Thomasclavelia ramosa TaxID=1547 RepID=UPI00402AF409